MKKIIISLILVMFAVLLTGPSMVYADEPVTTTGEQGTQYTSIADNKEEQDNYDASGDVTCGGSKGLTFNKSIANVVYYFVLVFQILGPVALIIWGMIDIAKGVVAGKDDDIKKGQSAFAKRLTTAIIMFLVITIVRFLLNLLSTDTIIDCFNCFVNGAKSCK